MIRRGSSRCARERSAQRARGGVDASTPEIDVKIAFARQAGDEPALPAGADACWRSGSKSRRSHRPRRARCSVPAVVLDVERSPRAVHARGDSWGVRENSGRSARSAATTRPANYREYISPRARTPDSVAGLESTRRAGVAARGARRWRASSRSPPQRERGAEKLGAACPRAADRRALRRRKPVESQRSRW